MSEDIDKRVLRKYEIREKLGKGVRHTPETRTRGRVQPPLSGVSILSSVPEFAL